MFLFARLRISLLISLLLLLLLLLYSFVYKWNINTALVAANISLHTIWIRFYWFCFQTKVPMGAHKKTHRHKTERELSKTAKSTKLKNKLFLFSELISLFFLSLSLSIKQGTKSAGNDKISRKEKKKQWIEIK